MSWSAYEELREIRENQERSATDRWARDNPVEAELIRQYHEASMKKDAEKKKEEEEARSKTAERDTKLGLIITYFCFLLPNLFNLPYAIFVTVIFVILWHLQANGRLP
jgi:hypothetical protein